MHPATFRHCVLFLLCLISAIPLFCLHTLTSEEDKEEPNCRSFGTLRFDTTRGPQFRHRGLEVCSKYQRNTCCDQTHVSSLRLKVIEPIIAEFSPQCQRFTEELACAACHPHIGTWKIREMCPSLCNAWYSACHAEYYSHGADGQDLIPCYGDALVCSQLSDIVDNGHELCGRMGLKVSSGATTERGSCFDGSVPNEVGKEDDFGGFDERDTSWSNPRELAELMIFSAIVALVGGFLGYKLFLRRLLLVHSPPPPKLSLEQVREMQQQSYQNQFLSATNEDSDSDIDDKELTN